MKTQVRSRCSKSPQCTRLDTFFLYIEHFFSFFFFFLRAYRIQEVGGPGLAWTRFRAQASSPCSSNLVDWGPAGGKERSFFGHLFHLSHCVTEDECVAGSQAGRQASWQGSLESATGHIQLMCTMIQRSLGECLYIANRSSGSMAWYAGCRAWSEDCVFFHYLRARPRLRCLLL